MGKRVDNTRQLRGGNATMARDQTTMKEKVRKLLNQAADQEGTPEAAVFYEKAFGLMAKHGFAERDFAGGGDEAMKRLDHEFTGTYTDMQMNLLNVIADALHCVAVAARRPRAVGVVSGSVFGLRVHVERVELLFALLNPMMAGLCREGSVTGRRSFMTGFAAEIGRRLREAEAQVGEEHRGYAVALISDRERARSFMSAAVEGISSHRRKGRVDPDAYIQGAAAARNADLGQTRISGRRGLPRAS